MSDMGIDDFEDIGFLFQDYIFECNEIVESITSMIDNHSPSDIEKMVHNLKGVSANLYIKPVYELAKPLNELLTQHKDLSKVDNNMIQLWHELELVYYNSTKLIVIFFATHNIHIDLKR
jgi:HPt (histidine-containing phosphotransfer) domain-containing protein